MAREGDPEKEIRIKYSKGKIIRYGFFFFFNTVKCSRVVKKKKKKRVIQISIGFGVEVVSGNNGQRIFGGIVERGLWETQGIWQWMEGWIRSNERDKNYR